MVTSEGNMRHGVEIMRCEKCNEEMSGVRVAPVPARTVCEECGGNSTKFNAENPHPESAAGKRKAATAATL